MFNIKKLKISGFKSFPYPLEIEIPEGITGIIGPNGCGKSNIFEAIRWVMGESSSKSLRSSSMEELIFSGTDNVPEKNIAEVTVDLEINEEKIENNLVMTNSLYHDNLKEVSVHFTKLIIRMLEQRILVYFFQDSDQVQDQAL